MGARARTEADFRIPDQRGFQPRRAPIVEGVADCALRFRSALPLADLCRLLADRGFPVALSDDAGRFVCNWI